MIHLHNHSEYSSLDGFSQINHIVQRAKELRQPAIALTDHGNVNGCYKFYHECVKNDIKPILGIELYLVPDYSKQNFRYHVTILAANNDGWENILKLVQISYQNFYYKPRVSFADLFSHKQGLICLSGCLQGILPFHLRNKDIQAAQDNLLLFRKEFEDDFYIEVMDHGFEEQKEVNHNLRSLSREHGIPCVCTNDNHYTKKEHALYQDYLMRDNLKTTIHDVSKLSLDSQEFYIKDDSELFCKPEEITITHEIADKCNVTFKPKSFLLPHIDDQEEKILAIINESLTARSLWDKKEYIERLREEFEIIKNANLIGYFLIVYDYIKFAKDNDILVGPGRGSVGGCLIGYLMGIHAVDPIKHNLLFSRFYNAGRAGSLPDIDIDFPESKIHLLRQYILDKYGKEKVAHIGTYTYLHPKSALKLICRVLGVDFKTANHYSSIIEDTKQTKELIKSTPSFGDIVEKTKEFIGLAVHSSIHAAGIIISPVDLNTLIPMRINAENDLYVSNWDMKDIEDLGLVKYDFLSLNTLDIIEDTLKHVNISIEDIPFDDKETFETINTTTNVGIFQLSSDGISQVANQVQVASIDDIAVVVALYRPGPINSGLHRKYINRKHGIEEAHYKHPLLEQALSRTYGIFVFQEQTIQAVQILAGFSEIEADLLRKAIGKKIPELMAEQKDKFIKGCIENKIDKKLATEIWNEIEEFSGYGFCAAHAVGYGYITYYTAYLKTHYPCAFMASLLNNNYSRADKLSIYLKECKSMRIEVVPPSVTQGGYDFVPAENKIYFGVKGIGGIGEKTAQHMFDQTYNSFEDFCIKFKPSSDTIVALAESGAFDEFGHSRNQIIQSASYISQLIKNKKKAYNPKAKTLFANQTKFNLVEVEELSSEILASKEYGRINTYLTYNPLEGIDLETPEELSGHIFIEGYLIAIREHLTKKKETMAFLTIVTELGQIEALLFPRNYQKKKNIIRKNTYISIEGTYEDKLLIKNIWIKNV